MNPLKVGLLVDGAISNKYIYELARWMKDRPGIAISHLIIQPVDQERQRDGATTNRHTTGLYDRLSEIFFRLVIRCEQLLLRMLNRPYADHCQRFDLGSIVVGVVELEHVGPDGGKDLRESAATVTALGLDLLIQCSTVRPHADILRATRLGVICLGDANGNSIPGPSTGFWECYYEAPQTAFNIRHLLDETGAGRVLLSGSFRTRYYCSLNQALLCRKAYVHLRNLLDGIASSGKLPMLQNKSDAYPDSHRQSIPPLHQSFVYGIKIAKRMLIKFILRLLRVRERWGISFLSGNWKKAEFSQGAEASLPKGRFWADPFLWSRDGKTFCFVEDYVYKSNRAHITALELIGTKAIERGIALKEPFHLSFPFLFQYKGDLYMCPESGESRQIRIYRCVEFPLKWALHRVVMDNIAAVDTVFFEKAGRWWMLNSIDQSDTQEYGSELYLFSSDSPLETHWVPHPQNPLRIDARGGRNAGLIVEGEKTYRLAQCQGFDQYGQGLLVYEIKSISETTYVEELVAEINPTFKKGFLGVHHMSTNGSTTVIDHMSNSLVM